MLTLSTRMLNNDNIIIIIIMVIYNIDNNNYSNDYMINDNDYSGFGRDEPH